MALAGINITFMLSELLHLQDGTFTETSQLYWEAFREEDSFYLLFSISVGIFDYAWTFYDASTSEFQRTLDTTRDLIIDVLSQGSSSSDQFVYAFSERGLLKL